MTNTRKSLLLKGYPLKKFLKIFTSSLLLISMLAPALPVFATESDQMQSLENFKGLGGNWNPSPAPGAARTPPVQKLPRLCSPSSSVCAIGAIVAVVIMKKKKQWF